MAEKTKWCGKNQVRAPQEATGTGTCTINSHLISGTFSSNHSGLRQTVSVGELHRWSGRGRRENTGLCKTSRRHHIITLQVELRGPTATRGLRLLLSARKPPPTDARRPSPDTWTSAPPPVGAFVSLAVQLRAQPGWNTISICHSCLSRWDYRQFHLSMPQPYQWFELPRGGAKAPQESRRRTNACSYMWQAGRAQKVLMRGALKQTEHLLRACYVLLYTVFTHDNVLNISPAAKNKDRLDLVCTWHAGLPTTTPMCSIDGAIMRTHTSVHASH